MCCAKLLQSCPTLGNPMDCSPPNCCVRGILQAATLEWITIPSSGSLPDPGIKPVSLKSPTGRFFITSTTWEVKKTIYYLFYYLFALPGLSSGMRYLQSLVVACKLLHYTSFFYFLVLPLYCYQPISLHPWAHMLSHVTPWTAPVELFCPWTFPSQEYCSALPFPSPYITLLSTKFLYKENVTQISEIMISFVFVFCVWQILKQVSQETDYFSMWSYLYCFYLQRVNKVCC